MHALTASAEIKYVNNVSNTLQARDSEHFQPQKYPVLQYVSQQYNYMTSVSTDLGLL